MKISFSCEKIIKEGKMRHNKMKQEREAKDIRCPLSVIEMLFNEKSTQRKTSATEPATKDNFTTHSGLIRQGPLHVYHNT